MTKLKVVLPEEKKAIDDASFNLTPFIFEYKSADGRERYTTSTKITNPELRERFFDTRVMEKLEAVSQLDWADEYWPFTVLQIGGLLPFITAINCI